MLPADMLQKAGGPGWTMWMGMAGWEPLSPWAPDALQGPVWLTKPFSRAGAGVEELGARPLWGRREGISQEATSLPLMDTLLSHLNPCHFLKMMLCCCNPRQCVLRSQGVPRCVSVCWGFVTSS